jgi:hypothetical protein
MVLAMAFGDFSCMILAMLLVVGLFDMTTTSAVPELGSGTPTDTYVFGP